MVASKGQSKKRSAPTQGGPKSKKAHLERRREKPASAPAEKKPKRSRPVTQVVEEESEDDDDEGEDVGAFEDVEDGDENEDVMETDEPKTFKDPQASKEAHKAQKILHEQRKALKPHSTLLADAKRVWCLANAQNVPPAERQKHIDDLMGVIRGHVKEIVFKHDASRIVQTAVKHGRQKERDEIALELKGSYLALVQSKYSKFLVSKLIRLCTTHRPAILKEFQGHVLRLLLHREATSVLADAFELYANTYERALLVRDFYGKEATLATVTSGSEQDKELAKKGLAGLLENADNDRRRRILTSLKESLTSIFNNSDKGAITHAVVHRVLWEYISVVTSLPDEAESTKHFREIFELQMSRHAGRARAHKRRQQSRAGILGAGHSEGQLAASHFQPTLKLWQDRKQIIKVLKPHVERMCLDDEAQTVLFTALDVIDDTKLLVKTLVPEITTPVNTLVETPQGRRAILYLLVPRTRRHFIPAQIASLAETDALRAQTSKKAVDVRQAEVRAGASEALLAWVKQKGGILLREPAASLVVAEIMLFTEGDKSGASQTLLRAVSATYPGADETTTHPIDLPHSSRLYKTLLQGGHFNRTANSVDRSSSWDCGAFARDFVEIVGQDVCVAMCTTGGCNGTFVIAELCGALVTSDDDHSAETRKTVKRWFSGKVRKTIEAGDAKGKKVLLDRIDTL
ncbi:PUM-HD domain-containing protein [Mycena indigotica]|uniref:PUM-HD domain-containing protein n=1 Tax=Mycena indigotica TaxID=2126181 RepID=A0A8H6SQR4_9AGAR|nr:PUM-HD domain-containing protein [Mycena indigotica]KAF7303694.1 PUM-HD domain-containing protein [Mycena indigotica]